MTMTAELTTAVSCHNAADGVITITDVSGGDGNYTFGISSNPTELSSDLVWEGSTTNGNNQTYSFTVYDGNGCTGSSEGVLVTNPQAMSVGFSTTIPNPVIDATCANIKMAKSTSLHSVEAPTAWGHLNSQWMVKTSAQVHCR